MVRYILVQRAINTQTALYRAVSIRRGVQGGTRVYTEWHGRNSTITDLYRSVTFGFRLMAQIQVSSMVNLIVGNI